MGVELAHLWFKDVLSCYCNFLIFPTHHPDYDTSEPKVFQNCHSVKWARDLHPFFTLWGWLLGQMYNWFNKEQVTEVLRPSLLFRLAWTQTQGCPVTLCIYPFIELNISTVFLHSSYISTYIANIMQFLLGDMDPRKREVAKLREMLQLGADSGRLCCLWVWVRCWELVKLYHRKIYREISLWFISGSSISPKGNEYQIHKYSRMTIRMIIIIYWSRFTISFYWLIIFYYKKNPTLHIFVLPFMYLFLFLNRHCVREMTYFSKMWWGDSLHNLAKNVTSVPRRQKYPES
jgi:hypothetical protein